MFSEKLFESARILIAEFKHENIVTPAAVQMSVRLWKMNPFLNDQSSTAKTNESMTSDIFNVWR